MIFDVERALIDDLADISDKNKWSDYPKSVKKQKLELSVDENQTVPYGQNIWLDLMITFITFLQTLVGWASTKSGRGLAQ